MGNSTSLLADGALLSAIQHSTDDAIIATDGNRNIILFNKGAERIFGCAASDVMGRPLETILPRGLGEARYRHALDSMLEGCQIIGFDWRYLYANEALSAQAHQPVEDLVGRTMMEAYPGIEDTAMFAMLRRSMEERTSHRMVNMFTFPDGSTGWFELSVQPVPEGIVILSNDITERVEAKARLETQVRRLAALRAIDIAITGSVDLRIALGVVLDQTMAQLGVDAACVSLLDPHTHTMNHAAGAGLRTRAFEECAVRLGEGLEARACREGRVVHVHEPGHSPEVARAAAMAEEGVVEYHGAPLVAKGRVVGMLEVFFRAPRAVDDEWRSYLETLAGQTAIAVDSAQLFENLQHSHVDLTRAYDATIEGWSRALDLRDKETEGHSQRVTALTIRMARALGIEGAELAHIRRGALLHDIGKMGVPDGILLKPGPLTDEEMDVIRRHPQLAYDLLSPIVFLRPALDIPYCHHEKWDGTGYPRGLKGEQIPLAARLFAAVDIWDALRSDRPYRSAWPEQKAIDFISSLAGTHLEASVVELFLRVIREG
jgi:PAS domain S-box-containing protein/putative nucleotidyltransferase with HDIG domain